MLLNVVFAGKHKASHVGINCFDKTYRGWISTGRFVKTGHSFMDLVLIKLFREI